MNYYHKEILAEIKTHAKEKSSTRLPDTYSGSTHINYFVSTSDLREIAKDWAKTHENMAKADFIALLDSLYNGDSYEEKTMGSKILGYSKKLRTYISPTLLNAWLELLQGWAEIDSLCQSIFTEKEVLANWKEWEKQLKAFAKSDHVNKKRASLVLLTGVVSHNEDKRVSDLAFENIERLQGEKDILVTKAISWLLRDLIKFHRKEVEAFLEKHNETLPKIAIRETKHKLLTGKKYL